MFLPELWGLKNRYGDSHDQTWHPLLLLSRIGAVEVLREIWHCVNELMCRLGVGNTKITCSLLPASASLISTVTRSFVKKFHKEPFYYWKYAKLCPLSPLASCSRHTSKMSHESLSLAQSDACREVHSRALDLGSLSVVDTSQPLENGWPASQFSNWIAVIECKAGTSEKWRINGIAQA